MAFRGITPVVKQVEAFKLFLLGDGFSVGQSVTVLLTPALSGAAARPITRTGTISEVFTQGAIAVITRSTATEDGEIDDDDVVVINVDVNGQTQQVVGGMGP